MTPLNAKPNLASIPACLVKSNLFPFVEARDLLSLRLTSKWGTQWTVEVAEKKYKALLELLNSTLLLDKTHFPKQTSRLQSLVKDYTKNKPKSVQKMGSYICKNLQQVRDILNSAKYPIDRQYTRWVRFLGLPSLYRQIATDETPLDTCFVCMGPQGQVVMYSKRLQLLFPDENNLKTTELRQMEALSDQVAQKELAAAGIKDLTQTEIRCTVKILNKLAESRNHLISREDLLSLIPTLQETFG